MTRILYVAAGMVLGVMAVNVSGQSTTRDPVKLSPEYYTVRFENDRVRVLEYHLEPGGTEVMHSHPPGVVYHLSDGTARVTLPDGTASESSVTTGEVSWRDSTTHAVDNVGQTELVALAIELKSCDQ